MALYFAFILTVTIMASLAAALDLYILFKSEDPLSNKDYSIYIAARVLNSAITVLFTLLHCMMLALYYKFSKLKQCK